MKDTENVAKSLFAALFFVMVLVMSLYYTVHNFRMLLQKMRDKNDMNVGHLAGQLRDSYKSSHQDLGEELKSKSIQQLQMDVATQPVELKSIVAQFTALQHQNDEHDKQD